MKISLHMNVLEAARKRIAWCFDHHDRVVVSWSGGKDSTTVLNLTLYEARKRGRLPLDVVWLDQECEFNAVVEYARRMVANPEINFRWYQVPFRLFNASSFSNSWFWVWGPGEEWMREKEPEGTVTDIGPYAGALRNAGKARFGKTLATLPKVDFGSDHVTLKGMRSEESLVRNFTLGVTMAMRCYVDSCLDTEWTRSLKPLDASDSIWPIYDWTTSDVWKAIHDFEWDHCSLYDTMYRAGIPKGNMRISSLCHAHSAKFSPQVQALEPDTWERLVRRLPAINDYKHNGSETEGDKLPFAFRSWIEYRDYLLEHIVETEEKRDMFRKQFEFGDRYKTVNRAYHNEVVRNHVVALVRGDFTGESTTSHNISGMGKLWDLERPEREAEMKRLEEDSV